MEIHTFCSSSDLTDDGTKHRCGRAANHEACKRFHVCVGCSHTWNDEGETVRHQNVFDKIKDGI